MTTFRIVKSFRANGHNIHNIVVIADKDSEELIDSILDHKEWGYRIVAIFSDSNHIRSTYSPLIRVLPERSNIKNILKVDIIDEVLYCKNTIDLEKVDRLIEACKELGVTFKAKSKVMPVNHAKVKLTHLEKLLFLLLSILRITPALGLEIDQRFYDFSHFNVFPFSAFSNYQLDYPRHIERAGYVQTKTCRTSWSPVLYLQVQNHGTKCGRVKS